VRTGGVGYTVEWRVLGSEHGRQAAASSTCFGGARLLRRSCRDPAEQQLLPTGGRSTSLARPGSASASARDRRSYPLGDSESVTVMSVKHGKIPQKYDIFLKRSEVAQIIFVFIFIFLLFSFSCFQLFFYFHLAFKVDKIILKTILKNWELAFSFSSLSKS
jgi:hypothetical protein